MAHDILNKFYDGDPKGEYAVNDTGKPLGDLLLNKTKTEIGDNAYNALSADKKSNTADLQQIILESSGPSVLMIEQTLALATDTAEDSWLYRLDALTGDDLLDRIDEFAPEAKGQDLAPSAAMSLLASHFEDYSRKLAAEWIDLHEDILWFEQYCEENDIMPDENDDSLGEKVKKHFDELRKKDPDRYSNEFNRYYRIQSFYDVLQDTSYSGEWGDPILADSLKLKTGNGSEKTPNGYNGCLHMFMEENPVKIDNEDYCYRSDNNGMYLFWKGEKAEKVEKDDTKTSTEKTAATEEPKQTEDSALTASVFGTGSTIAISSICGLIVGILGATLVLLPKIKKKKENEET